MRIQSSFSDPPTLSEDWYERWAGPDSGIICSWLRGIEMARSQPTLAAKAMAGELPVLPWKGGVEKAIKRLDKVGAFQYLAMWQGLRRESLDIDMDTDLQLTCSRTGVLVTFTGEIDRLLQEGSRAAS